MMRSRARQIDPALFDYSEAELRAAHAELVAQRRILLPFQQTMHDPLWRPFIHCKAKDLRNRAAARARTAYVPACATNIAATFRRAQMSRIVVQRPLELEVPA